MGLCFFFFSVGARQLWVLAAAQKHKHKTIPVNQQNDNPTYCVKMSNCRFPCSPDIILLLYWHGTLYRLLLCKAALLPI